MFTVAILAALVSTIYCRCGSRTYYASPTKNFFSHLNYENNELCWITIRPFLMYSIGYYLEIKWDLFEVEGFLPTCPHDSLQVYLTSKSSSIGIYCSDNVGETKLFPMYSSDGYAKFLFKTDSTVRRRGFKFSFQLKSYQRDALGTYGGDTCYYSEESKYTGIFYSSGWPRGYKGSSAPCFHSINVDKKRNTRVALMDMNLRNTSAICNNSIDNVQMRDSSNYYTSIATVRSFSDSVTGLLCYTYNPGFATTTKQYSYLIFNRPVGSFSSHTERGVITGYISYSTDPCFMNPCTNGGTCVPVGNLKRCNCLPGFTGVLCHININECQSDPCQNGATCVDKVNDYSCTCSSGFIGKHCEIKDTGDKNSKIELIAGIATPVIATVVGTIGYAIRKRYKRRA